MFNNVGLRFVSMLFLTSRAETYSSLVDSSLTGFQSCYILLVPALFLMYSGYFGFPVALVCTSFSFRYASDSRFRIRGVLWVLSRVLPKKSSLAATLFFLRDHPRRVSYLRKLVYSWDVHHH
jgi:Trk-type K+ transport system membrane component